MLLVLAFTLIPCSIAAADGGIEVVSSDAQADFPQSVTFSLEARASTDIVDIDIECQVVRRSLVPVICRSDVAFDANEYVMVSWNWDMQDSGGVPPGTEIEYRWLIEDAVGNAYTSPYATVRYDDLRYNWRGVTSGNITLWWYEGDSSFAQQLIDAADGAVIRLTDEFDVSLNQPIDFYIYADPWDLQSSLVNPDIWTGGQAFPDYGAIMIGIEVDNLDWGERTVAHELGHLVVGQLVYGPFGWIPTWLSEGIAMNTEGELTENFQDSLDNAVSDDSLFSVRSIASSFPADSDEAILCYAESYSIVKFLVDNYGSVKFLALLDLFKQGVTDDEALSQVYGFDTDGLNENWRASLGLGPQPAVTPAPTSTPSPGGNEFVLTAPYIALITIVVILSALTVFLGFTFIRRWR
ncbi:MAG: peptidase MA family metallohydrolase [Dehalococcoidia bacterium]